MTAIHFLMDELEFQAQRGAWSMNGKGIKEFVFANNHSVPGHLDDRHKWTTEEMVDNPTRYVAAYEEALKTNTSDMFWDKAMYDNADDALLLPA